MPESERKRTPALFDAFGFASEASVHGIDEDACLPIAAELAAAPLPPTSRQHPERLELAVSATGAHTIAVSSMRAAKRPANWVRKLNALNAALLPALQRHQALLLPGPTPFGAWEQEGERPASFRGGLRLDIHFARERDFGRLHAAIRMALPLLPALAAATPLRNGHLSGQRSARLRACLDLYDRFPERVGGFIPEAVFDPADHDREVLGPIAQASAAGRAGDPPDPQALNLRCATAHLDQGFISIHGIDAQENPAADMAVLEFAIALLRALVAGRWSSNYLQRAWSSEDLMAVMLDTIRDGSQAAITNRDYLFMLGMLKQEQVTASDLLKHLFVELYGELSENARAHVGLIVEQGCLADRMLKRLGRAPSSGLVHETLAHLAACRTGGAFL